MAFNLNTPPKWAVQAARELDREWPNLKTDKEVALTIATYAPDAEALAILLGEYLREFDGPHSNQEVKQWLDNDWIPSVRDALRQYRARFPKA